MIDPSGRIDNGSTSNVAEAITNGYVLGDVVCGASTNINGVSSLTTLEMFPNPASSNVTLKIGLESLNDVSISILDVSGKLVKTVAYNQLKGTHFIDIDVSDFVSGMYVVNVQAGEFVTSKSLVLK